MASFTITTAQNITQLTGKTGNDTYSVNGGTLTVNSDTRFGPNTSATTGPFGNITVSTTLGGAVVFSGASVRLIPFSTGTGNVPASGTTLSQGGVTCELLCVMSDRTGGTVTAAGGAMPASGWLKVRNVAGGSIASGALTGIGVVASGPDETGWIVVVGCVDKTISISRLGSWTVDGRWFTAGTTSGARGQTVQLPFFTGDQLIAYPGVEIETAPGSGVYKMWHNVAAKFTSANCSTDSRSRYVYISDAGLLTIGTGVDASVCGDLPVAGCAIRVPNIILQTCAATSLDVTVRPYAGMTNRYDTGFSNAGILTHSLSTGAWYWNIVQPYSVYIRDLHTCDQLLLQEPATKPDIDRVHVGLSNYAAGTPFASNAIVFQQCYTGGTVGEVTGVRAESISTSGYAMMFVNLYGVWTFGLVRGAFPGVPTAVSGPVFFNTCDDVTVDKVESIGKRMLISACNRIKIKAHQYADLAVGTTPTTVGSNAVEIMSQSADIDVQAITNWPGVANCHPYTGLIFMNTTKRGSLRFVGSDAATYNCGTVNPTGYIFSDGGNNIDCKVQRNWVTGLRINLASGTNTNNGFKLENCYNTDASKTIGPQYLNAWTRGNRQNGGSMPTSYIAVYGTCYWDAFTGDTTARAAIIFVEKTTVAPGLYIVTAGTPVFNATGSLLMRTAGDQIIYTWPYRVLGWSGFSGMVSQGTNTANHAFEYDVDKGAGFSGTWKTLNTTNLSAEAGVSPTDGWILRIRITCTATNSGNKLDSLRIDGVTTLAAQNAALYPLDAIGLTVAGIIPGSDVVILESGTTTVLDTGNSVGGSAYTYTYSSLARVDIAVYLSGYEPEYIRDYQLTGAPVSLPVTQKLDRNFSFS